MRLAYPALLLLTAFMASRVEAKPPKDSLLSVRWTFRQKEDGRLSRGIHMARLTCIFGKCELEVLTLNQCGKDSFWPAVERVTSEGPEMSISDDGKRLEIRVHNNEYSATHTISYTKDSGDVLVTNYSGGFTKYSDILEKVIAVEYVPVRSIDGGRWATWKLDCDVQIPVMPGKASR